MNPRLPSSPLVAQPATSGPSFAAEGGKRYRVFLSYSHADTKWATWLMRRLEGYRVPARFYGRVAPIGEVGGRIAPVFRDRDELPTTSDLGETIRSALRESATLVVLCSPASAKSRWVREEILTFKRLGGSTRVFAFVVAGEPKAEGTAEDCFSPALRSALGEDGELSSTPAEHVAADARAQGDGREDAFVRLVAGLLGVGFDELRQREQQRRLRRLTWIAALSGVGMAITLSLATVAWQARNDAQRRQGQAEDLLGFMLVDLRLQLDKAGKLDLLESVGDKAMNYVASLGSRDLTDATLSSKVKALTVIGVVRAQQLRAAEASKSLAEAHALAGEIVQRHPEEGPALFDRGQAEFWIGNIHYTRGDTTRAGEWFTRYRDTSVALAGLDPANARWQREAVSGHHNLAVLELERGNLGAARNGFLGELTVLEKMSAANPGNLELQSSRANVVSFLGTIAERSGNFVEAGARFEQQAKILETLIQAEPRTVTWQERLANSHALRANVLAVTGQRAAALGLRTQARALLAPLIAADPANRNYQRAALKLRLQIAMLARTGGEKTAALRLVDEARAELEALAKNVPGDRRIAGLLAVACRLDAEWRGAASRDEAAAAAARPLTLIEPLLTKERIDEELTGEFFHALLVAGQIARELGDAAAARQYWQRVVDGIQPRLKESNNWRLLDPAARALACLGRTGESRAVIERLSRFGYQPLQPWPDGEAANL